LSGEPGSLADIGRGLVGISVRVIAARQRNKAAQRRHRSLVAGDLGQEPGDELAGRASGGDLITVPVQLGAVGRVPALQQVGDLLEGRVTGKLIDVVTTVEQTACLAVYVTERGRCSDDIGQPSGRLFRHMHYLLDGSIGSVLPAGVDARPRYPRAPARGARGPASAAGAGAGAGAGARVSGPGGTAGARTDRQGAALASPAGDGTNAAGRGN